MEEQCSESCGTAEDEFPDEIREAANAATSTLLPIKSKEKYQKEYNVFIEWCESKKIMQYTEDVCLAYFFEKSKKYKSSSLWTFYSMLRSMLLIRHGVNISEYKKLEAFLKRTGDYYKPKKSKILTKNQIDNFIQEAPDDVYLMMKVAVIVGIAGACRGQELCYLTTEEIEDLNSAVLVKLNETKTKISRRFTIIQNEQNYLGLFRKYAALRPPHTKHNRFFVFYKNGKCSTQPVGRNTFGAIPSKVAAYLQLPEPTSYTGHCLRRSSATLLADSGGDITDLKRHGGWRSAKVAEGYIEDNLQNKLKTAEKILGKRQNQETVAASTSAAAYQHEHIEEPKEKKSRGVSTIETEHSVENLRMQTSNNSELNILHRQEQIFSKKLLLPSVAINNCNNVKVNVQFSFN